MIPHVIAIISCLVYSVT